MAEEKKEHLSNREKYGSDFTCPDCGRTAAEGWELVGILKKSALHPYRLTKSLFGSMIFGKDKKSSYPYRIS